MRAMRRLLEQDNTNINRPLNGFFAQALFFLEGNVSAAHREVTTDDLKLRRDHMDEQFLVRVTIYIFSPSAAHFLTIPLLV